ncbi:MAG: hypothetical protein NWE95_09475 [Candidatus Bathyarchaeota archaeon]|nr:hypothetical protein [Candidatus Bathyarchaeota archaeon]
MLEHKTQEISNDWEMLLDDPPSSASISLITFHIAGPPEGNALCENWQSLAGTPDGSYAHLYTEEYRDPEYYDTDESIIVGVMDTWAIGNIYLTGYSEIGSYSDVCVCASDDPNRTMLEWDDIGYARFTQTTPQTICVGTATNPFLYIAVFSWAREDHELNDAYVDSAVAYQYGSSPNQLIIEAGQGGTTDPEPDTYYSSEPITVTAIAYQNYEFDHWLVDCYYQSTDNPIEIEMWDGDHTLEACFCFIPTLTITSTSGGTTNPTPGQHQYDYGTGVTVYAIPDQGSSFSYWLLDNEYVYTDNSIYVDMSADHDLEAHFNEALPTCQLTITAYDYTQSVPYVEPNVWVDSQWVGTADLMVNVQLGTREVWADDPCYVEYYGYGPALYTIVDGEVYSGGAYAELPVWRLHKTIEFVYIWQK